MFSRIKKLLVGIITDSDIRKGLIKGLSLKNAQ